MTKMMMGSYPEQRGTKMKKASFAPVVSINKFDVEYALEYNWEGDDPLPKISKADVEQIAEEVRYELSDLETFWDIFNDILKGVSENHFKLKGIRRLT